MKGSQAGGKVFFSLILLLFFNFPGATNASDIKVVKGVMDLSDVKDRASFSCSMSGDWEFYYNRFITPSDTISNLSPDCYQHVPGFWNNNRSCEKKFKGTGYASYRCVLILPHDYRGPVGFDLPAFNTAYRLYINKKMVAFNGNPSTIESESSPVQNPILLKYTPISDTLEIVVNVSNYHHNKGGFWLPIKVGPFSKIQTGYSLNYVTGMATSSMLFFSFCFFFLLYLFKKKYLKALYFSIILLTLAISPFFSPPYLISLFGFTDYYFITKAEYLVLSVMALSSYWFLYYLYPSHISKKAAKISTYIIIAYILFSLFSPVIVLSYTDIFLSVISSLAVLYAIVMSIRGMIMKRIDDTLLLIAFLAMAYGGYSDIMLTYAMGGNKNIFILSNTMLVFSLIQSILIIKEWVRDANEKEKLNLKLEDLARNLETRVNERTHELKNKSAEIEKQNQQITEQNKKLSDIITVKDKIFALISHDLRSPVVNILYGLNLIKEDKDDTNKEQLTASCIQNSQMVINLLENMLVWGREQEDRIRFSPANNDFADVILTNMSIYKEGADRKNIVMNFTQIGNSKGWFDKDLVDIIFRNLLSNAIKFTNVSGRINITLKEGDSNEEALTLKISDNGVGISKNRIETLFSGKTIQSTFGTENEKGTGIGLKLVYELVGICQGSISVESKANEGTTVTVVLPDLRN